MPVNSESSRSALRQTARVVLPLMAATFIGTSCDFVSSFFSARHSNGVLCAALPASAVAMTFVSVLSTIIALSGTFFARAHGAGYSARALSAFRQGLLLAMMTIPLFLLAVPVGDLLFETFAHEPTIHALERTLYRFQLGGGFCLVLFTALSGFLSGQGRTRFLSAASIAGCLTAALTASLLINGCGSFPALGVHGLGLAVLFGKTLPCLLLLIPLLRDPLFKSARWSDWLRPDRSMLLDILRQGIPAGLSVLVLSGTFTAFTLVIGRLDTLSVTAINICFALNGFYWVFVQAAEQAVTILVGRALGAKDVRGANVALRQTAGILLIPLTLFFAFCLTCTDLVTRLLYDTKSGIDFAVLRSTVRFILMVFVVRDILEAGCHLIGGVLTAALDTRALLVIRLAANAVWIMLLGAAFAFKPTLAAYVALTPIQMALVLVPLLVRWYREPSWRRSPLFDD